MAEETRTSTARENRSKSDTRTRPGRGDREYSNENRAWERIPGTSLFDQALDNYEQALKAGLRLQEESTRWWAGVLNQAASPAQWQRAINAFTDESFPAAQKQVMEEALQLVEQNSRKSLELLRKASQVNWPSSPAETQVRLQELWKDSLELLRSNAAAMVQANQRALDIWMEAARRHSAAANGGTK